MIKGKESFLKKEDTSISRGRFKVNIFTTTSRAQTQRLGRGIGLKLKPKTAVCLVGELGTGKTTLIQGIAKGLGIEEPITSPSFKLISEYKGRIPLYHFDLWRLSGLKDLEDLGYREYFFGDGIVVIEWAEKAREIWPDQRIEIYLEYKGRRNRRIRLVDFTGIL